MEPKHGLAAVWDGEFAPWLSEHHSQQNQRNYCTRNVIPTIVILWSRTTSSHEAAELKMREEETLPGTARLEAESQHSRGMARPRVRTQQSLHWNQGLQELLGFDSLDHTWKKTSPHEVTGWFGLCIMQIQIDTANQRSPFNWM